MNEVIQLVLFLVALVAIAPLLGKFMAKVFMGQHHMMKPVFGWLEKLVYKVSGIDSEEEMNWKTYTVAMLIFNVLGILVVYLLPRLQASLPLNPAQLRAAARPASVVRRVVGAQKRDGGLQHLQPRFAA